MHELLPWYATGALEADEATAFRAHLEQCAACREELRLVEKIRAEVERHGPAFLEPHPPAEQLVASVTGQLEEPLAAQVRRHVALCDACAREARWVAGEEIAGADGARVPRRLAALPWGWIAAAAAVLTGIALLLPRSSDSASATRVVEYEFVRPPELAEDDRNVIRPTPGQPWIGLVFEVDFGPRAFPITIEIENAQGAVVVRKGPIARETLLQGVYLTLDCDLRDCAPGSYTASIRAAGGSEPDLSFRFEVAPP